jgi:spoIIIJ-associated protein
MEIVEQVLKELLEAMGATYSKVVQLEVAGQTIFSIVVDDARALIGPHGDTIHAIDFLLKKIIEQKVQPKVGEGLPAQAGGLMFLVDVNDYRTKQIKDLQTKALMMAERARSFQYDVELSPMSAYERLIVHTTLQNAPNIKTESQGEGRNRRVVIKYAADANTAS